MMTTPLYFGSYCRNFCRNFGSLATRQACWVDRAYDRVWTPQNNIIRETLLQGLLGEVSQWFLVPQRTAHLIYGVVEEVQSGIAAKPGGPLSDAEEINVCQIIER